MTRTYVVMEVSKAAYDEIKQKLLAAGYNQAIHKDSKHEECLDMHGIALSEEPINSLQTVCGCRIPSGYIPTIDNLKDPAQDCPFCDGTGFLIRTVPRTSMDSYVKNCIIVGRNNTAYMTVHDGSLESSPDVLFSMNADGLITARLDGFVIVPKEKYFSLLMPMIKEQFWSYCTFVKQWMMVQ